MAVQRHFEPDLGSAQAVRQFVTEVLPKAPHLSDVVLAASELASNVVRHAKTRFTVRLSVDDDRIRLEVSDGSSIIPAVEELTESQRGLRVIDRVAEHWGFELTETGKIVWAEFPNSL